MEWLQNCVQADGEYVGWAKITQYIEIDLNREICVCWTWRGTPYKWKNSQKREDLQNIVKQSFQLMKERSNLQNKTISKQLYDKPKSWLGTILIGREMDLIQALGNCWSIDHQWSQKNRKYGLKSSKLRKKIDINSDKTERLSIATDTRKRSSANDFLSITSTDAWRGIDVTSLKMWKLRFRTFAGNSGHWWVVENGIWKVLTLSLLRFPRLN
jgi:hypothetical protein